MINPKIKPQNKDFILVRKSTSIQGEGDMLKNKFGSNCKAFHVGRLILVITLGVTFLQQVAIAGQAPVALGSASTFGVLAGSTVTTIPTTTINGDLGVFPGNTVTGAPIVNGTTHLGDPTAAQAQSDLTIAYNDAAGRTLGAVSVAGNLGGQTLPPGLYKSATSLEVSTGDLTLDAQGDANAVWIFQMGTTFTTTSGRQIVLSGGAQARNVFWQVGSSATIGTTSVMKGTVMADQSITMNTGASLEGRALARVASVALDANTITVPTTPPPVEGRFYLVINIIPSGGGTVNASPGQPTNGYTNGTVVTLTATGTNFQGWTGSTNGTATHLTVTMNAEKTITAHFGSEAQILFGSTSGQLAVWFLRLTNVFNGSAFLQDSGPGWRIVGTSDLNNDGQKDFIFQAADGRVAYWLMNGNRLVSSAIIGGAGLAWRAVGVSDFDGDGDADILFQHDDGRLAVWFLNGTTFNSSFILREGQSTGVDWKVVGVKDFNGNGKGDILFQHTNGQVAVWYMNGTTLVSSVLVQSAGPTWRVVGLGDFNNDGKTDFLWQNTQRQLAVWFMNGITFVRSEYVNDGTPLASGWQVFAVK